MKKNKMYTVLVICTVIFLFAIAAVCGQSGDLGDSVEEKGADNNVEASDIDDNEKSEDTDDSKKAADTDDSEKKEESKDTDEDKSDSDKKDEPKSEDTKKEDENKPPVISGIYLDGLDPIDYFFFADDTYTVRAEAIDPEGSTLSFKWSGEGFIASKDLNPMTWTAPGSEGVYNITVEATDDKGSTATKTVDIYVNLKPVVGAVILEIQAIPGDDGKFYMGIDYMVVVTVDDPLNEIDHYYHDVEHNTLGGSMSKDGLFNIPHDSGDIDIIVSIYDGDTWPGNLLDEKTITIYVESTKP